MHAVPRTVNAHESWCRAVAVKYIWQLQIALSSICVLMSFKTLVFSIETLVIPVFWLPSGTVYQQLVLIIVNSSSWVNVHIHVQYQLSNSGRAWASPEYTRNRKRCMYYLFVRDLAQQRLNAHSQTPRGRQLTVTGKGRHQRSRSIESRQCSMGVELKAVLKWLHRSPAHCER